MISSRDENKVEQLCELEKAVLAKNIGELLDAGSDTMLALEKSIKLLSSCSGRYDKEDNSGDEEILVTKADTATGSTPFDKMTGGEKQAHSAYFDLLTVRESVTALCKNIFLNVGLYGLPSPRTQEQCPGLGVFVWESDPCDHVENVFDTDRRRTKTREGFQMAYNRLVVSEAEVSDIILDLEEAIGKVSNKEEREKLETKLKTENTVKQAMRKSVDLMNNVKDKFFDACNAAISKERELREAGLKTVKEKENEAEKAIAVSKEAKHQSVGEVNILAAAFDAIKTAWNIIASTVASPVTLGYQLVRRVWALATGDETTAFWFLLM